MVKKVALISCVSKKLEDSKTKPVKVKDLYVSPLFTKAWKYATNTINVDEIYILSAKHHLLHPDTQISYYDETLVKDKSAKELRDWCDVVTKQLHEQGIDLCKDEIYVLAGAKYHKYLIPKRSPNIKFIYEGKRIGEILHFLDQQNL